MKSSLRLAVLACASGLALAVAGTAAAAYTPKLSVATATGQEVQIRVQVAVTDDPTFKATIYVPTGYTATLNQAFNSNVGTVRGQVNALDLAPPNGLNVPVEGAVRVDDPAKPEHNNSPCAPGRHQAVWLLALSAGATSLAPVPMYVDATTGAEAAFSSFKMQICLPPPDVPAGTPGRATLGVRLLEVTLSLTGVFNPPSGQSARWSALFTPWTPRVGQVNAAGTVQAQSIVRSGTANIQLSGRLVTTKRGGKVVRRSARLSGSLPDAANVSVDIFAGSRKVATVRANASGGFSRTVNITRTTTFTARATVAARDVTPATCVPAIPGPTGGTLPCVSVTEAGYSAQSNRVTVRVPKTKRRR